MTISKKVITIASAVLLSLLIGFVFGAAYGRPDGIAASGKSQGSISAISMARLSDKHITEISQPQNDTIELTGIDAEGNTWNIKMTTNK